MESRALAPQDDNLILTRQEYWQKELAKRKLYHFFQQAWLVLEPATPLHLNWQHELICEHLQRITWMALGLEPFDQLVLNLLINAPPRSLKSRIVSVFWPCWEWLHIPHMDFLCLSFASSLANDHNDDRRTVIQSAWYQTLCGGMRLSNTKNRISEFRNDKRGQMLARGLDGAVTGVGGRRLIFDDPNDPENVESELVRESTLKKFKGLSSTRKNDPRNTAIVIVQQRTHVNDVSGHIQAKLAHKYTQVILPSEAEKAEVIVFPISGKKKERRVGDLLDPKRFGPEEIAEAKDTLSPYQYAGRHQQRPTPAGGGIVQLQWFNRYDTLPHRPEKVVISVDTAQTAKETSAYWAIGVYLIYRGEYFIAEVYRRQMVFPVGQRAVISICEKYRDLGYIPDEVLIENKSNGIDLINNLKSNPDFPWPLIPIDPEADKVTRMESQAGAVEAGKCFLPSSAGWLPDFELEVEQFPLGFKDQIDQFSQFLKRMKLGETRHWASLYQTNQPPQVHEYGEMDVDLLFRR